MQISKFFYELRVRARRIARASVPAAWAVALSTLALSAQAANIYAPPVLQPNGANNGDSTSAVVADFNNDGYPDMAVVNRNNGHLLIYLGNGTTNGTLALSHDYTTFGFDKPNAIVAGDIDGDGKIDLVVTDNGGVSILKGSGDIGAAFSAFVPQRLALKSSDYAVTNPQLADLNHDGRLDIVVGTYKEAAISGSGTFYFEVLQNLGLGNFTLVGTYEVYDSGSVTGKSSHLVDIDGDGELDQVYVGVNKVVAWLKGVGNGTFLPAANILSTSSAGYVDNFEAVDIDGDGKVDLVLQNVNGNGIYLAKGTGLGTFYPVVKLFATTASNSASDIGAIIIADVNGDGLLDIVSDGNVALQQANHSFVVNEHIGYSENRMLAALDLNKDGRPDLVTAGYGPGQIAVFKTQAAAVSSAQLTGTPQSTVFSTAFSQPLTIKVLDGANIPLPNISVIIIPVVPGNAGASATSGSGSTNAQGIFSYTPIANNTYGCYQMKALVTGMSVVPVFDLCNTSSNVLAIAAGNNQSTPVGTAFATNLQVQLTDGINPIAGVTVTFGGPNVPSKVTLSSLTAVTNASGLASVTATASGTSGPYTINATAPGNAGAVFKLSNTATAGAAAVIAFTVGTPKYAYVTKAFSGDIVAHVTDFPGGNPVQGATVNFAVKTDANSGATASFSALTAVTDVHGDATVTATANGSVGTYGVTASVPASLILAPQTRTLRNIPSLPNSMQLASGTPQSQSTPINTTFSQKLRVKVAAFDGVTPQVRVYFLANGGAILSSLSALADVNGIAEVTATADGTVGSYQVTAIVYDTSTDDESPVSQTFDLTNTAAPVTTLSVASASIVEGNAGTSVLNFPVTLSAVSPVDVVVTYSTTDGTATTANNDYVAVANGTVTIPAGQLTGVLPVTINGDTTVEPDETFAVTISNATNAVLGAATATGTILNDDVAAPALPVASVGNASIVEGNVGTKVLNFPVTLSIAAPVGGVTVIYSTVNGTASAGSDYVAVVAGSVNIPAGSLTGNLPVTINGDTTVELDETFTVSISNVTNATLGNSSATGTIINDDAVVPPQAVVPVPVNSPLALFALTLGVLGFAWRRATV